MLYAAQITQRSNCAERRWILSRPSNRPAQRSDMNAEPRGDALARLSA